MGGSSPTSPRPAVHVGVSGWRYPPWRGTFYPKGLRQRDELHHISRRMGSVEVNGSFYSLQRPQNYLAWAAATPDHFVFAVKGGRFITHLKKLSGVETALANFFGSGVLALGDKLGPVLWQLPAVLSFDADRVAGFLEQLPRTTTEAAALSLKHDERLEGRAWTTTDRCRPIRHALEARHASFAEPRSVQLLRRYGVALVVSDSAGTWPQLDERTADFAYARLHGDAELYTSGYTPEALRHWANRVRRWRDDGRDVYVYFDNDVKVRAPFDAIALAGLLGVGPAQPLRAAAT